jgi:hypothetical protein
MDTRDLILEDSEAVTKLLLLKNEAYGDSALNPAGIFAGGDAVHNLCCRIDDKLMRIKMRGITDQTEDTVQDLIGYLDITEGSTKTKAWVKESMVQVSSLRNSTRTITSGESLV